MVTYKNPELVWPVGTVDPRAYRCPVCGSTAGARFDVCIGARVLTATCGDCRRTVVEPAFADADPVDDWRAVLFRSAALAGAPRFRYAQARGRRSLRSVSARASKP